MASLPSTAKARVESTLRDRALSSEQELAGTFTGASTMCVWGGGGRGAGNMTVSKADLSLLHGPHKHALELARITRDEGLKHQSTYEGPANPNLKIWRLGEAFGLWL